MLDDHCNATLATLGGSISISFSIYFCFCKWVTRLHTTNCHCHCYTMLLQAIRNMLLEEWSGSTWIMSPGLQPPGVSTPTCF